MADPAGATNYIEITADHTKIAASMPDVTDTFAADLVVDEAAAVNYEGGAETFIDGLAADYSDLRVYNSDASIEIPFGVKQFSQTAGSRKLILGLGIPSSAPLLSGSATTYRLYRGCTSGPFENKSGCVPTADGYAQYVPMESAASPTDWTSNGLAFSPTGNPALTAGAIGQANSYDGSTYHTAANNVGLSFVAEITLLAYINMASVADIGILERQGSVRYSIGQFGPTTIHQIANWPTSTGWKHVRSTYGEITAGVLNQCAITYSSTDELVTFYANGALSKQAGMTGTLYVAGSNYIGDNSGANLFNGAIDEVQIHSVVRSADWISTYYAMTADNDVFWTVGAEQSLGGGLPLIGGRVLGRTGPSLAGVN